MGENNRTENVLVATSGGVDSAVAALLLKQAGYNVKSVILRMHDAGMTHEDLINGKLPEAIWYAREASRKMRLDFSIVDVREDFDQRLFKFFIDNYEDGKALDIAFYTQKHMQLPQLLEIADKLGCGKVATGHYAIIEYNEETGRYVLKKSKNPAFDQSYKLYRLSQGELSKMMTPLGQFGKDEVRKIAEKAKLKNVRASDDLCFIPDEEYWHFAGKRLKELAGDEIPIENINGLRPGVFVDKEGNILGEHRGFFYYTIGTRNGLDEDGIESDLYVCKKNPKNGEILLTKEEDLYTDKVKATEVNFVSLPELAGKKMRINAKLHYMDEDHPGWAEMLENGVMEVTFDEPVKSPVPGLSMVIYDGDMVVAGGIIITE